MRRGRKQPVLVGLQAASRQSRFFHLDRGDLDKILGVLNRKPQGGPSPLTEALIGLMKRLEECGGNLKKMMDDDPELAKVVTTACTTLWLPSKTGRAHLVLQPSTEIKALSPMPEPQEAEKRAELLAALYFHVWTLNPEWDKLAGPCARCGQYYLKKRASQKVYCSPKCGHTTTATARRCKLLDAQHAKKLQRAEAAMQEWHTDRTKDDWKAFVSKREPDITPKFLTRAVTKGDLVPPTKGR